MRSASGALAERFRVVAPDLRGYNLSEKPATGYDVETLTDILSSKGSPRTQDPSA